MRISITKEHANVSEQLFHSPLNDRTLTSSDGVIELTDESATTKILVRGQGPAVAYGQSKLLPNGTLICGSRPDEWLFLAGPGKSTEVQAAIDQSEATSIIDITHGRAMMRLSGPAATQALAKVCSIDLADDLTPDGAVFSASVAKVTCDLVRADRQGIQTYLISCERSFGAYLISAVADAAQEFGLGVPAELSLH
jgi:heterotetrameric sarcosine oxidase gamma subunit